LGKIQIIESLLDYILLYSFLVPVLLFSFLYKKIKGDVVCYIILAYSIIFFLLNFYFDSIPDSVFWRKAYHFSYTFLEYISFTCIIFLKTINLKFKRFIFITSLFFTIFQIYYTINSRLELLDSIPIGIESILIFIFIVYYLFEEFRSLNDSFIFANYIFWISLGIILYLGLSFFFNILLNSTKDAVILKYWNYLYILDVIKNFLFAYAIFLYSRNKNQKIKHQSLPNLDMI
jgi:hypothetical protein